MKGLAALLSLVLCGFTFNLSEFMPAGILAEISDGLGIAESEVGLIISAYAWIVAIFSVPLMVSVKNVEHKKLLIVLMAGFAFFQMLLFLTPTREILIVSRIAIALLHCVFWSILIPMAAEVVEPEKCNFAIASVASAGAIAMIVGIPIGRTVAIHLGWEFSFMFLSLLGIAGLAMVAVFVGRIEAQMPIELRDIPTIMRNRKLLAIILLTILFMTGHNLGYCYIEGYLDSITVDDLEIGISLFSFGLAGLASSVIFSHYYTRYPKVLTVTAIVLATVCVFLIPVVGLFTVTVICLVWGGCATMFNIIYQKEAMQSVEHTYAPIATSMFSGTVNIGIALGSLIGAEILDASGYGTLFPIGGAFLLASFIFYIVFFRRAVDGKTVQ